jgi:hypothetical protein
MESSRQPVPVRANVQRRPQARTDRANSHSLRLYATFRDRDGETEFAETRPTPPATMAIPLLPILKVLPTILTALSEVTSALKSRRASGSVVKIEERTKKLEDDLLKTSTALAELTSQVQSLAEGLQVQLQSIAAREMRINRLCWLSTGALGVSLVALGLALFGP